MYNYDIKVLDAFIRDQCNLYPQEVASNYDEADEFLSDIMALVVDSAEEVIEYFEGEVIDLEGTDKSMILEADEVFDVGDGRYLILEV